jgi:WD40 repeat protein
MGTVRLRHTDAPVAFAPDGKTLISVGGDLTLRFWDPVTGKEVRRKNLPPPVGLPGPGFLIRTLTPDGKTLAFGGGAPSGDPVSMHVWDATTGKERCRIVTNEDPIFQLALSADGKTMAAVTGHRAAAVRLWDTTTGKEGPRLEHKGQVWRIAISPDGKVLASVDIHITLGAVDTHLPVHLWDVATGKELRTLPGKVSALAFSPDGKTLVSGGHKAVKLWDVATGKEQATFRGLEEGGVRAVALSPDGTKLAVAGWQTLVLWEVATRKELLRRPVHFTDSGWLTFAPDGQTLAGSGGYTIHLWDVATGKALHAWQGHEGEVDAIAYSPDGKVLSSASRYDPALRNLLHICR